jgi:integrase
MIWPLITSNGNRLPLIKERPIGVPLYFPTVYTLAMLQAKSSDTMDKHMYAIMYLYTWAEAQYRKQLAAKFPLRQKLILTAEQQQEAIFYLEKRFSEGKFLRLNEIENLVETFGSSYEVFCDDQFGKTGQKITSLAKAKKKRDGVSDKTKGDNLRYCMKFVDWLSEHFLGEIEDSGKYAPADVTFYTKRREKMLKRLKKRVEQFASKRVYVRRYGLPQETQFRLMEIIDPSALDNPWKQKSVKLRNQLFVRMELELGARRGELLILRTTDIDTTRHTIKIKRRPRDKGDTRRNKPNTKSRIPERELLLSPRLSKLIHDYIVMERPKFRSKSKNTFLFIATDTGLPMSKANANAIYKDLSKHPDLPKFSPHILRHTWNDNFTYWSDKHSIPEEKEIKWRMEWMGWRDRNMALVYTARSTREQANEAFAKMHEEWFAAFLDHMKL